MSTNSTVAGTTRCGLHDLGELVEPRVGHGHDADVGLDGRERVVGGVDLVLASAP